MTLIHANCFRFNQKAILLRGKPGSGKSDITLRAIEEANASLIADDQVKLHVQDHKIFASAPRSLAGLLEIRGLGFLKLPYIEKSEIGLIVDLVESELIPAFAQENYETLDGISLPCIKLDTNMPSIIHILKLASNNIPYKFPDKNGVLNKEG